MVSIESFIHRKRVLVSLIDGDETVVHSQFITLPVRNMCSIPLSEPFPDGTRVVAQFIVTPHG